MHYVAALVAVAVLIGLIVTYWQFALAIVIIGVMIYYLPRLIRHVRKQRYFASEEFLARKSEVASIVAEHNEIASYISEIRASGSFSLGESLTGSQSHLASFENTSQHNYRRDRNLASYHSSNVHNCSLQVVRNAAANPLKYLTKYFNIPATEDSLTRVEALGESISRLEEAVANARSRETSLTESFQPPAFILKYYSDEFMAQIGVDLPTVEVPYPEYAFEYVSAGGNSSQKTTVQLDTPTIDALVDTLSARIRFRKSAAGQRALMTAKLRNHIKLRDGHTCRQCSVSVAAEPHLLLEVDHIIPVSRGGLSTVDNLQTLCWRCNRTKSNKVPTT